MPELTRTRSHRLSLSEAETPVYNGYEIIRRLGVGAGSVIYHVKKTGTDQNYALKHVIRQNGQDKRMIIQVESGTKRTPFGVRICFKHPSLSSTSTSLPQSTSQFIDIDFDLLFSITFRASPLRRIFTPALLSINDFKL